jgi:hypothetical protein
MTAHMHHTPSRARQSCANCDAFVLADASRTAREGRQGFCHAGGPHLVQLMQQGHSLAVSGPVMVPVSIPNVWPPVTENEWCRLWKWQDDTDDERTTTEP